MIDRNSEFFRMSKEIAVDFLQSTVIIDDFTPPRYASSEGRTLVIPTSGRRPPVGGRDQLPQAEIPTPQQNAEDVNPLNDDSSSSFDARAVISAFSKQRIVCSVINPQETERDSLPELIRNLADCADIVVIDWSLHEDEGQMATEILASILRQDATRASGRLRLLAIFTVNPAIAKIATEIKEKLERDLPNPVEEDPDGFSLSYGATRIVILAKPEYAKIPSEYHHRIVGFDQLAERLTDEFAQMTAGLVSNVVISAFSSIRKNTYRVLSRFSENLDSPYLSHRFMSPEPPDAESHLTALVAEELQALLEEANVGEHAGIRAIKAWFDAHGLPEITLDSSHKFSTQDLIKVLDKGLKYFDGLTERKRDDLERKIHKLPLSQCFQAAVNEKAESLDERFSCLTMMRSHYEGRVPSLRLGTILKPLAAKDPPFLVCVQPRCDCVRVSDKQNFPFLPLLSVPQESRFDTVLLDDGQYVRLAISRKPYDLVLIPFGSAGNDQGPVTASKVNEEYRFEDCGKKAYKWIGELRGDHALRLSDEFSSTIGRVGLDESEWLRRWAKR